MAAAEYYHAQPATTHAAPPRPPYYPPPASEPNVRLSPAPQQGSSHLSPYAAPPPPPYSPHTNMQSYEQKPSAPTSDPNRYRSNSHDPQQPRPRVSFSQQPSNPYAPQQYTPQPHDPRNHQYFPSPQPGTPQYLNPQPYAQQHAHYLPPPPQQQQQQLPYGSPYGGKPAMSQISLDSSHGGYSSDPEAHRHHHRRRRRSSPTKSRGNPATDGLLGAAGGGLIGDLIFPGLGTVGGALAGWVGGRDYAKHKERHDEIRKKEQRDWERKFSRGSHDRERPKW